MTHYVRKFGRILFTRPICGAPRTDPQSNDRDVVTCPNCRAMFVDAVEAK